MTEFEHDLRLLIKDTEKVINDNTIDDDVDPLAWDLMVKLDAYREVLEMYLKGLN